MDPDTQAQATHYHGFWPVLLIGLSVLLVFTWEIQVNMATRQTLRDSQEQQTRLVEQSTKVQAGLEKLVRGLVDLAKTDEEAKKLVAKFGVKLNNPTVPTSTPAP